MKIFSAVLEKHKVEFSVNERDIRECIIKLGDAYSPNPFWEFDFESKIVDFKDAGLRCAYIHKYAMLHTSLACDVLQLALLIYSIRQSINSKPSLRLCSLGSGPGTDIVALIFALNEKLGLKKCRADLIDLSAEWEFVFESVVSELRSIKIKNVNEMVSEQNFSYQYFGADLLNLSDYNHNVLEVIQNADIITMVKFISAAACKNTIKMIEVRTKRFFLIL